MINKIFLGSMTVLLCVILFFVVKKPAADVSWPAEQQREYANKLKAEGLNKEAVVEYEKYLSMQGVEQETQANIYYTIGKMQEEAGEYEKALASFYKVELVYPEIDIRQELGEHIVACLEKTGRGIDAQNSLEERSLLGQKEEQGGEDLARIGNEKITSVELNKELEKLPDWMKAEYSKPEKKMEFLKQYIAVELLWRKAKRLAYDKDPDLRQRLEDVKKELMVKKLLEKEMEEKVKITPDQIELYYKANKEKYTEPAKAKVAYISSDKEEGVKETKGEFTELKDWALEGDVYLPGIGESKEMVELIFKTEPRNTAGPAKVGDKFYLIKVLEKQPEKQLLFDEVKDKVAYEYQLEKQKIVYQELLDETLKTEDVEIYGRKTAENTEKK